MVRKESNFCVALGDLHLLVAIRFAARPTPMLSTCSLKHPPSLYPELQIDGVASHLETVLIIQAPVRRQYMMLQPR